MSTTLLRGGSILTPERPEATALLVDGTRIGWLGDEAGADRLADQVDAVLHLDGGLVTPGFVDAHVHLSDTGAMLRSADLTGSRSREEALERIARQAALTPGPLSAPGWDETRWPDPRPLTAQELDRAAGGARVYSARIDCHSAVISTSLAVAIGAAELDGWRGDGLVERNARDVARDVFTAGIPPHHRSSDVTAALQAAAALGIVQVHECAGPLISSADDLATVQEVATGPALPEVVTYWGELVEDERQATALAGLHGVRGLAGDLNVDGSIGSRTAYLRTSYADEPGHLGHGYLTVEQVRDHVAACSLAGLQAGFHVIGDAGADTVLAGIEAAAGIVGVERVRAARHRLEHIEMVDAAGLRVMAELGVYASVQPMFDGLWGGPAALYATRLGVERAAALNPLAAMQDAGVVWAAGSDTPVTPFDPWGALRASVRHRTPSSATAVDAAVHAHTVAGYRAAGIDDRGRLRTGGEASLAVWADEIRERTSLTELIHGEAPRSARLTLRDGVVLHAQD